MSILCGLLKSIQRSLLAARALLTGLWLFTSTLSPLSSKCRHWR